MTGPRMICAFVLLWVAGSAWAQGAAVDLGGLTQDTGQPVEVASDSLAVDQADGTAIFTGNVLVTQGQMQLSADKVLVIYAAGGTGTGRIEELRASGGVTLASATEAAEAQEAIYTPDAGTVTMTGDVVLTQGSSAISGNRLTIDLTTGRGTMEGRVRTIFSTGSE